MVNVVSHHGHRECAEPQAFLTEERNYIMSARAKSNVSTIVKASEINPDVVIRAANTKGAKQGKDSVAVKKDYSQFVREQVAHVRDAALGMAKAQATFIQACVKIGEVMEHSPDVGKAFVAAVRIDLVALAYEQAGIGDTFAKADETQRLAILDKTENWPEAPKQIWSQHLSKVLSNTKRVIKAFEEHLTQTMAVLSGPGTAVQKMLALPKASNAGRKKGASNKNKAQGTTDGTTSTAEQQEQEGAPQPKVEATLSQMAQNVLSLVANLPISATFDILQAFVVKYRAAKTVDEVAQHDLAKLADTIQSALKAYLEARAEAEETARAAKQQAAA